MHVRTLVAVIATMSSLLAFTVAPAHAAPGVSYGVWAERAESSYRALQQHLYLDADQYHLYLEKYPKQAGDNDFSYLWPMREATAATLDLAHVPGNRHYRTDVPVRFGALERYWGEWNGRPGYLSYLPPPLGGGGDIFYDDNAIVGLEHARRYAFDPAPETLRQASKAFDVVIRGWNDDPSLPCPGGMRWVEATWIDIRAANVTGLGAQLAAHLYELTGEQAYLEWAERLYDWNRTCLRSPDGLYWNDIGVDGTINKTLWTYNSGAMIGAAALLYRSTGDPTYRTYAREDATAAIGYWTADDRYFDQPAIFNAIWFKNLLLLHSVAPDASYRGVIARYASHIWHHNRDASIGLFRFPPSGGGPYDPSYRPETLEQSAAIQIFAALAWSPRDYGRIA
jgi:hypothetical protein